MTNLDFYRSAIDAPACIGNAWNLYKNNFGLHLATCLVATLIMIVIGCIPCMNILLIAPVNAPLIAGIYYVFLRDMRGEPVDFAMMFKGFEKFVPVMIVGLLQAVPALVGQIMNWTLNIGDLVQRIILSRTGVGDTNGTEIAVAGGFLSLVAIFAVGMLIFNFVWGISFAFSLPLIMERNIGPGEAITLSIRAGWSNFGGLILLFILEGLIALLGVLMLCFGIFFVLPIIYAANAFAYRQVFPLIEQQMNMAPPPPHQYGSSFGQGM
jgi:uncharacterized membrane protein